MKKVILFFVGVFVGLAQLNAQQISQSFEGSIFPPSGWNAVTVTGTSTWEQSSLKARTGQFSAFIHYESGSGGSTGFGEHWLISPKVVSVANGDKITFYLSSDAQPSDYPIPSPYYDKMEVYLSTTGNTPADFAPAGKIAYIDLNNPALATGFVKYEYVFTPAFYGQSVYIGLRHFENQGNSVFVDDFSAGTKLSDDLTSFALNFKDKTAYPSGLPITVSDTIANNGTSAVSSTVPVSYMVNGVVQKTVNANLSLNPGDKTVVSFTGADAFVPPSPGTYEIKVFTDWATDANRTNDTITYQMVVQQPNTVFPFYKYFDDLGDWILGGNRKFKIESANPLTGIPYINPAGLQGPSIYANTLSGLISVNDSFLLRSPLMDFTGISKPMLNFYVAAGNIDNNNDVLQIMVSTDGGNTFGSPVYFKSGTTTPKLQTRPKISYPFVPSAGDDWRHEIVDLSSYSGKSNVMIQFKVISKKGNNVWLNNIKILAQDPANYTAVKVASAPTVVTGPLGSKVNFVTLSVPDSMRIEGSNTMTGIPVFDVNTSSTNNDGKILTPNMAFPRLWTAAYSGNTDIRATYDISLDVTGVPGVNPGNLDSLYILKRADESGPWQALTTTRVGNVLTATSLTDFSDFAVGYYSNAVPVTVLSFSGKQMGGSVELSWNTSQEANILSYDIEKWNGGDWVKIGTRQSSRFSMQNSYSFEDINPSNGINLYRLRINSEIGSIAYSDIAKVMVSISGNRVYQNVPNPFRNYTIIRYDLEKSAHIKIVVYDISGRKVSVLENSVRSAGNYQVRWDAGNVLPGTYFYKVMVDDKVISKTMLKVE